MTERGRLFSLQSFDASENMAIDQAIMDDVSRTGVPTLRFYRWERPTLSLGYFQPHELTNQDFADIRRVRRTTGGGAILHHHELTYSLTVALKQNETRARQQLYRDVHTVIAQVLRKNGIVARPYQLDPRLAGDESALLCFQRRTDEDLIVSGYKVLGSAQRRTKTAVLQHGSLLIQASLHAPQLPGLTDLTSISLSAFDLAIEITSSLGRHMKLNWNSEAIPDSLLKSAEQISQERFDSPEWWLRR